MNANANLRPRLHTPKDVALTLKLCTRTILRMIERGELKAIRIGRSIRIEDEALDLYLLRAGK
jgi:excisionase family DNA binding protein